jgi:HTH-type transcriptional regulator/antitoxin HigA
MTIASHAAGEAALDYFELVHRFPLRPIQNDAALDAAIAMINQLLDRPELTDDEDDYLEVLSQLVEKYEDEHLVFPEIRGVQALVHLMEENDLKQSDLAHLFGGKSAISEVLRGNRSLSKNQIARLRDYFGVPADVFID